MKASSRMGTILPPINQLEIDSDIKRSHRSDESTARSRSKRMVRIESTDSIKTIKGQDDSFSSDESSDTSPDGKQKGPKCSSNSESPNKEDFKNESPASKQERIRIQSVHIQNGALFSKHIDSSHLSNRLPHLAQKMVGSEEDLDANRHRLSQLSHHSQEIRGTKYEASNLAASYKAHQEQPSHVHPLQHLDIHPPLFPIQHPLECQLSSSTITLEKLDPTLQQQQSNKRDTHHHRNRQELKHLEIPLHK